MRLTKFEQSAFVIEAKGRIAVDFGSLSPEAAVKALPPIDAALVSHSHGDHCHPSHLAQIGAPVFGALEVVEGLNGASPIPPKRVTHGSVVATAGVRIEAFAVNHGPISAPIENLGFLFEDGDHRVLFAGDIKVPAPLSTLPAGPYDAVLVPVGDGKVFGPAEAAAWVESIGHRGLTVPCHFDGRADPATAQEFAVLAGGFCQVVVLGVGESLPWEAK